MTYPNFTLSEFIQSDTAAKRKIDNTPDFAEVDHIGELVSRLLQPLRSAWGRPIHVTSGYRCQRLNAAVGGSSSSAHLTGWAADVQPSDMGRFDEFCRFTLDFLERNRIRYDQVIVETSGGSRWLHLGIKNSFGQQRMLSFNINK